MRPLETHVQMTSHLWMFNRVKDLLVQEGLICRHADDAAVRDAVGRWLDMIAEANDADAPPPSPLPH